MSRQAISCHDEHRPKASYSHAALLRCGFAGICCVAMAGCLMHVPRITSAANAVPVRRLPPELLAGPVSQEVPIDFRLLCQEPLNHFIIGPGDTLGIYIEGIVPGKDWPLQPGYSSTVNQEGPYPALGLVRAPFTGFPLVVNGNGQLELPQIGSIDLSGLTLSQAAEKVRRAYVVDRQIVQPGHDQTIVSLIKPRVHRLLVIREDMAGTRPSYRRRGTIPYTERGTSHIVDLPTGENDVLHALMASGGLPGIDAYDQVTVLRSRPGPQPADPVVHTASHIPLRTPPNAPWPFSSNEIVLQDGDIVFVRSRIDQVFYTGGLLPGAEFSLPRDRDLDVLEAIATTTAAVGASAGSSIPNFHASSPGGIVAATRALVIRQLPNGNQLKIHVDLNRAAVDPTERLIIRPNDFILLEYTPAEYAGNLALTLLRLTGTNPSASATNTNATNATGPGGNPGGETPGGGGGDIGAGSGTGTVSGNP